jgi:hypothetical protein
LNSTTFQFQEFELDELRTIRLFSTRRSPQNA